MYRTASSSDNAWMVNFKASDETANGRTSTIFYLGIVNKNGKMDMVLDIVQLGRGRALNIFLHTIRHTRKILYYMQWITKMDH